MSFILFAAWFTDDPVSLADYPMLMISGLASFFGSLNVAIPFLLDLQKIPSDMFQLFIVSGVLNSRFGTLLAAMHTLVLGVLVACAVTGGLKFNPKKIFRFAAVTICLTAATIGGARLLFTYGISHEYKMDQIITEMHLLHDPVSAIVHKKPPSTTAAPDVGGHSKLQAIKERGFLRVGYYVMNNLPFGFFNTAGDLVGFDVEMAHILAKDLGVTLEFVPVTHDNIAMQLESNYCDIVMAGILTTIHRATKVSFSNEYLSDSIAFIVKDYRRHEFISPESRENLGSPRIGDFTHIPIYTSLVHKYFPQAEIEPIDSIDDFFNDKTVGVDAVLATTQRGAAFTLLHPKFTVALPRPDLVKLQLAYPISYQNSEFHGFINTWISLKKKDGTIDALYDYWILGKNATPVKPRWSVIRDVLHWVD